MRKVAVAGTGIGPHRVPHLVEVQGRRLTVELEPFVTVFRYADLPGMIGRVGTIFGRHGINISSAAVGHTPDGASHAASEDRRVAAMVVTTDAPVPAKVVDEIVASEGFTGGWAVVLVLIQYTLTPDAGRRDIEARRAGGAEGARASRPASRRRRGADRGGRGGHQLRRCDGAHGRLSRRAQAPVRGRLRGGGHDPRVGRGRGGPQPRTAGARRARNSAATPRRWWCRRATSCRCPTS